MFRKTRCANLALIVILLGSVYCLGVCGQSVNVLDASINLNARSVRPDRFFANLAEAKNVSIGFEFIDSEKCGMPITFSAKKMKLRDVLDGIISLMPCYKWTENNGVVAIRPVDNEAGFLQTKVNELVLADVLYSDIGPQILANENIASEIDKRKFKVGYCSLDEPGFMKTTWAPESYFSDLKNARMNYAFNGLTLEQILDKMLVNKNARYWVMRIDEKDKSVALVVNH